ncbi:MAG: hypothetical protein IKA04_02435 [Alistipes sp.]|nr:hypothetical protein [Alistipes sp.]
MCDYKIKKVWSCSFLRPEALVCPNTNKRYSTPNGIFDKRYTKAMKSVASILGVMKFTRFQVKD